MSKSFAKLTEVEDNLMVVDALNLSFRYRHSKKEDFATDYVRTIQSLAKSYKSKWIVIVADKGSSSYRKNLYPEYKANRKEKYANQTEAEQAEFAKFMSDYEDALVMLQETTDYPLLRFNGVEADDIAAYISSKVDDYPIDHLWLISTDKDYDLLIRDKISRFSYVTRKEITNNNWSTHYDFNPEDYISIKCLQGDTGDNVFGVEGIGPKRAQALIEQYGTALDIVASLPINSKLKYVQNLNNSGDLIMLNYQLMDLVTFCDEAIGKENIAEIDKVLKEYIK